MFEDLFSYPRVLARHRTGPSANARERLLAHCAGYGAARGTLLGLAKGSSTYQREFFSKIYGKVFTAKDLGNWVLSFGSSVLRLRKGPPLRGDPDSAP
jgi:hypothetical protein